MDDLSSLPLKDYTTTSREAQIIDELFPEHEDSSDGTDTALIGYATLLFVALANPFLDSMLRKLPVLNGSDLTIMAIKTLTFIVILFIIQNYCI